MKKSEKFFSDFSFAQETVPAHNAKMYKKSTRLSLKQVLLINLSSFP